MHKLLRKRLNKKGFTLIELIVVIAILAILAAIAIPAYTNYKNSAAIAADEAQCKVIYDAVLMAKASLASNAATADIETKAKTLLESGAYGTPQEPTATTFTVTFKAGGNDVDYVSNGKSATYP